MRLFQKSKNQKLKAKTKTSLSKLVQELEKIETKLKRQGSEACHGSANPCQSILKLFCKSSYLRAQNKLKFTSELAK
jgi:hypothetical protein